MSQQTFNFKVVILGEGCVGKTSLVLRYVNNTFNEKHATTIQASFLSKRLNIDGKKVNLAIWDTAGQERFHSLGPIYYRDADGALLVYDITDVDSFAKVKNWVKELRKMLGPEIVLCIAGNKCDMERTRTVPLADAESYSASVGAKHYSTSAKLDKGISEPLFIEFTHRLIEKANGSQPNTPKSTGGLTLGSDDDTPKSTPDSGCCG